MVSRPPLLVHLYGETVAELTSSGPGQITCRYTDQARDRWDLNTPLLSCSLPLSRRPNKNAAPFFRGLLPEGAALAAVAAEAGVPTFDTFGILTRFGRDIAGAASIGRDDLHHGPGAVVDYPPSELERDVADLDERPLALHDDSELSLAGLQNKLLLVQTSQGWGRPAGGYPSTHILKVEDRRYPGMAVMEAACLELARAIGLTNVEAWVERIGELDCIIVSRFDRRREASGSKVSRVHQEDLCQALAVDIDLGRGRAKYEEFGGPGWRDAARLLTSHAGQAAPDQLRQLVRVMVFTYVIGNGDAHGKNLALLHEAPGIVRLAPLYDTVPTALWLRLPDRSAMWVNGQPRLSRTTFHDLVAEARSWPMSERVAETVVTQTAEELLATAARIDLPEELASLIGARSRSLLGG